MKMLVHCRVKVKRRGGVKIIDNGKRREILKYWEQ